MLSTLTCWSIPHETHESSTAQEVGEPYLVERARALYSYFLEQIRRIIEHATTKSHESATIAGELSFWPLPEP